MSSIAYTRRRYAAKLPNKTSGYILRPNETDNGAGGLSLGGPTRIGPIPFDLRAASGRELKEDEQLQQRGAYRLKLPFDTDLQEADQFEAAGQVYNVKWTPPVLEDSYLKIVGIDLSTPVDYGA